MHEWMRQAGCLNMVDEMWDANTPSVQALRVCFRCPVQRDCLAYGLRRNYATDAGVLGGLGIYDREKVRDGQWTVSRAVGHRLAKLVAADWEDALDEEFLRTMPQLELL
jgi:hypothetical protein